MPSGKKLNDIEKPQINIMRVNSSVSNKKIAKLHRVIKYFLLSTNETITVYAYCKYIQEMHGKL